MMDMDNGTANRISGWSDLASMALLGLALMVGELTPKRPVWGRSRLQVVAIVTSMLALTLWTGFRFVYEGITVTAPREFLAGSVIYLARWFYLMLRLSYPGFKEARMFQVARALREVHNIRTGPSTDGPRFSDNEEDQGNRRRNYGRDAVTKERRVRSRGEWDVIVRKGVHRASDRSRPHWRGFIDPEPIWHPDVEAWDVSLVEEKMHMDKLDIFGTTELMKGRDSSEEIYNEFYKVVLTAVRAPQSQSSSSAFSTQGTSFSLPEVGVASMVQRVSTVQNVQQQLAMTQVSQPQLQQQRAPAEVDFEKFTSRWSGLKPEFIANRVGATDERPIGYVARRVAADALGYVKNQKLDFRTPRQVACINECLEDARRSQFTEFPILDEVRIDDNT